MVKVFENPVGLNTGSVHEEVLDEPLVVFDMPCGRDSILGDPPGPFPINVTDINLNLDPPRLSLNEIKDDSIILVILAVDESLSMCSKVPCSLSNDLPFAEDMQIELGSHKLPNAMSLTYGKNPHESS